MNVIPLGKRCQCGRPGREVQLTTDPRTMELGCAWGHYCDRCLPEGSGDLSANQNLFRVLINMGVPASTANAMLLAKMEFEERVATTGS